MPFHRDPDGTLSFRCINSECGATTMRQTRGWWGLTELFPESGRCGSVGMAVKVYVCSFCGYAEFYYGAIIEPRVFDQ